MNVWQEADPPIGIGDRPRPEPLADAAVDVSRRVGPLTAVLVALAGGALTGTLGQSFLSALLGIIPGVFAGAGTVFATYRVAKQARSHVTPVRDPRDELGNELRIAPV